MKQDEGEVVAAKLGESSKKINLQLSRSTFLCINPVEILFYGVDKENWGVRGFLSIQATASAGNIASRAEFHSRYYADVFGDSDGIRPKYSHFKKRRLNYL